MHGVLPLLASVLLLTGPGRPAGATLLLDDLEVSQTIFCESVEADSLVLEGTLSTTDLLQADAIEAEAADVGELFVTEIHALDEYIYIDSDVLIEPPSASASFFQQLWKLQLHHDFDESTHGWTAAGRSSCDGQDFFLGGHCQLAQPEVRRTLELPSH